MIDSHLHLWELERFKYSWITPDLAPLNRDYGVSAALKVLRTNQINHAILVEANNSYPEIQWLLEIANTNPEILGVIGWCDLTSSTLEKDLEPFLQHKKFVGVRPTLPASSAPDSQWEAMYQGLTILEQHQLTCDLLIQDRLSLRLKRLIESHPRVTFILNHMAGANYAIPNHASWRALLECFAHLDHVHLKVSGFLTAAKTKPLRQNVFNLFFETALDLFGIERLIFGSDHPVCTLAGQYQDTIEMVKNNLDQKTAKLIFQTNTARIYNLNTA